MTRPKLVAGLIIATVVIIAGYVAVRMLVRHFETEMMEHKGARETTGVIVGKEHVHFEAGQTSYQNDQGRTVPVQSWMIKTGEFRVFYKMNDFDQVPASKRGGLVRGDQERERKFGPRFTIADQQAYDQAQVGQPVIVNYRWASDSDIEVIGVDFPREHSHAKQKSDLD
jgi:hypothetical protein